ncbi:hypothetical protein T03_12579 [Trichinella britovi]|uniref:Uncharacterized protein n=1 Tax=Trichinella britovi TaxID=45882 RepID=A0A0V0YY66_TRIBR|nr:hypothetical protein T03_12579 [Trichinella britovi]
MKKLPPEEEAIEQNRFVMQWEFYKSQLLYFEKEECL